MAEIIREVPLSEILPGRLWQSGCPVRFASVQRRKINAVVAVGDEVQPWIEEWEDEAWAWLAPPERVRRIVHARLPLMDCPGGLDAHACDAAIGLVLRLLRDPDRRVLVHCDAGAYRSVHVAAGVVAMVVGISGAEAFRRVDRATGHANPRSCLGLSGWREHVQTFGREARRG